MKLHHYLLLCLINFCLSLEVFSQVTGVVADESSNPLPFASLYVAGTTNGTITNEAGEFQFSNVQTGQSLVFSYIGYEEHEVLITAESQDLGIIRLNPRVYELGTIVVRADAEDPAYPIIRSAMAKRKYYLNRFEGYSCDVYIKGLLSVEDLPGALFGNETDTSQLGILYLSETRSKLRFQPPNGYHEEIIHARTSGDNQGLSFNTARLFNVNFYENMYNLNVNIPSPISNVAMNYYRYKLLGSNFNENGFLIHKIEVISKNPNGPAWSGVIYIVDEHWLVAEADLWIPGNRVNFELFDTFHLRQMNINVQEKDGWLPGNQQILMKGNIFGIKFGGYFTGVFSNYDFVQTGNINQRQTIIEYLPDAFELDPASWDKLRPIPLTDEEFSDFRIKDSLLIISSQPAYIDSIDRIKNKLQPSNLAFGYIWQKRTKGLALAVQSPFTALRFNPVQGFVPTLEMKARKTTQNKSHTFGINTEIQYGIAEEKFRGDVNLEYKPGRFYIWQFVVGADNRLVDYDANSSLTSWTSSWINLRNKLNNKKYYSSEHIYLNVSTPVQYPLRGKVELSSGRRNAPENNTNFSIWHKNEIYSANTPIFYDNEPFYFASHTFTKLSGTIAWQRHRGYMRTVNHLIPFPSNWPLISAKYTHIFTGGNESPMKSGGQLELSTLFEAVPFGTYGVSRLRLNAGTFLADRSEYFMDFKHFHGNESWYMEFTRFGDVYKRLPYYKHATAQNYAEAFYEHDFKGALFRHIPGIKKLGLSPVVSTNAFVYAPDKWFVETSIGIDRIGIGFVRLFRFDVVAAWDQGNFQGFGFILSSNTSMFNLSL